MRVSDVLLLKGKDISHDGRIWTVQFSMQKTDKPSESFPLWPACEQIIRQYGWPGIESEEYVFPYIDNSVDRESLESFKLRKSKIKLINRNLDVIRKIAGIQTHLTTHVARHSFGSRLDQEGWEIQAIQRLLRHADPQTTQVYIDSMLTRRYDERLKKALMPERS